MNIIAGQYFGVAQTHINDPAALSEHKIIAGFKLSIQKYADTPEKIGQRFPGRKGDPQAGDAGRSKDGRKRHPQII